MKPFRQLLARGGKLIKNLTFWSVVIGFLFVWDNNAFTNLSVIGEEKGWFIAINSPQYFLFLALTFVIISLLGLFYTVERKLNTRVEQSSDDVTSKLDMIMTTLDVLTKVIKENTEELRVFRSMLQHPSNKEGSNRTDNQT